MMVTLAVSGVLLGNGVAFSDGPAPAEPAYYASELQPDPQAGFFVLPAGSALHAALQTPINTALSHVGDPVEAAVTQALYIGQNQLLTKNARLKGRITVIEPPMQGKNAVLGIRFERLTLQEEGPQLPIAAHIRTDRPEHVWGGELTQGTKPRAIPYHVWGIGAYNRIVMDGPRQMGSHIRFLPGERMTVILEAPVPLPPPLDN